MSSSESALSSHETGPANSDDGKLAEDQVLEVIVKEEVGKVFIAIDIAIAIGLFTNHLDFANPIVKELVSLCVCAAFAFTLRGILSKNSHPKSSALFLLGGIALTSLSVFGLFELFIDTTYFKPIPAACFLVVVSSLGPSFVNVLSSLKKNSNAVGREGTDVKAAEP